LILVCGTILSAPSVSRLSVPVAFREEFCYHTLVFNPELSKDWILFFMARICNNCNKGVMVGKKVARARQELLYRSPKAYKPNLHTTRIPEEDGSTRKVLLCTKCKRMVKQYIAEQASVRA
jgi:ribosomal protein L28